MTKLSPRLLAIVDGLGLEPGTRVLEVGCGPGGAMAREMARRVAGKGGLVLAIDRSAKAIASAKKACAREIEAGLPLSFRRVAVEDFVRAPTEAKFDLVVAVRVGALDGRHPDLEAKALEHLAAALESDGRLFVDDHEVALVRPERSTRKRRA